MDILTDASTCLIFSLLLASTDDIKNVFKNMFQTLGIVNISGLTMVWYWQWKQTKNADPFMIFQTHESEKVAENTVFTWDSCERSNAAGDRWVSVREAEVQNPRDLICCRKESGPETIGYSWEEGW